MGTKQDFSVKTHNLKHTYGNERNCDSMIKFSFHQRFHGFKPLEVASNQFFFILQSKNNASGP